MLKRLFSISIKRIIGALLLAALGGVAVFTVFLYKANHGRLQDLPEAPLEFFIRNVFEVCNPAIPKGNQELILDQIVRVADAQFTTRSAKESFVLLLCVESAFNPNAKSKAGAVGIGQIMPKLAQGFANECDLGDIHPGTLSDTEVNLRISACHFNTLLKQEGSTTLALAAYNSGAGSKTTKELKHLGAGNPETMGYIAKFCMLSERVSK